jgi:hypothetical protein
MSETMSKREEYIKRLGDMAYLLQLWPDMPLPYSIYKNETTFYTNNAEDTATVAKFLPTSWSKNDPNTGSYDASYYILTGEFSGAKVTVMSGRENVCERKQVGTEKVVHAHVKAVPAYTEERPIYEYECTSLLSKAVG